jgi:DNA-binding response OmpR family regulator
MDKKRILVVDDEPNLIRSLSFILTKHGYEVTSANNGEEALQRIRESWPDLIFLDIMMPRKNGFEVCEEIRKMQGSESIHIVMLSAKGASFNQETAMSSGAVEYISKPFSPQEIVTRVKQLLS